MASEGELIAQLSDDGSCDLLLELEDTHHLAIKNSVPKLISIRGAHQLRMDTETGAGASHATFEHMADAELLADGSHIDVLSLEREC